MKDSQSSDRRRYPEWFYKLSPREQQKQIRRWRYYRSYYRRRWGPEWASAHAFFAMVGGIHREVARG